jgi:hypothetical protein
MAKCELKPANVDVVLTLTMREAQVLRRVLNRVGGAPGRSARGVTDGINDALKSKDIDVCSDAADGSVNFD